MPSTNALYTDLSQYYDLMCADIDYRAQSDAVFRLHQLFGNGGKHHLDIACGTGPHLRYFIDQGFKCSGVDLNQPMLDIAKQRCPEAIFYTQDMSQLTISQPQDLITCFLYSIHYNGDLPRLTECLKRIHHTLNTGGLLCFNAVDKLKIDNQLNVSHTTELHGSYFAFSSGWHYVGFGDQQLLNLAIEKTTDNQTECWHDQHPMVAISFAQLQLLLAPYFDVIVLAHDYEKILPWDGESGNALFVCIKR